MDTNYVSVRSLPSLKYTGVKGSGPVLPLGTQNVYVTGVAICDDGTNNPFSTSDEPDAKVKPRNYHDRYPVVAIKVTNKAGGLTERYHFYGFKKYAQLTIAEKEMTTTFKGETVPLYWQDMNTGNALTFEINSTTGKKVPIPSGVKDDKGVEIMNAAVERVIDPEKSAIAQRIFNDFLVACRIPANEDETLDLEVTEAQLKAFTGQIEITVTEEIYEGKSKHRMTNPKLVSTAVPAEEASDVKQPAVRTEGDF